MFEYGSQRRSILLAYGSFLPYCLIGYDSFRALRTGLHWGGTACCRYLVLYANSGGTGGTPSQSGKGILMVNVIGQP